MLSLLPMQSDVDAYCAALQNKNVEAGLASCADDGANHDPAVLFAQRHA